MTVYYTDYTEWRHVVTKAHAIVAVESNLPYMQPARKHVNLCAYWYVFAPASIRLVLWPEGNASQARRYLSNRHNEAFVLALPFALMPEAVTDTVRENAIRTEWPEVQETFKFDVGEIGGPADKKGRTP